MIRALAISVVLTACSTAAPQPGSEVESTPAGAAKKGADVDFAQFPWSRLRGVKPIHLDPDTARWQRLGVKSAHAFLGESPEIILAVYEFADQRALLAAKDELLAVAPPPDALQVRKPPAFYRKATWTGAWLLIAGLPAEKPPTPQMMDARDAHLRAFGE